MIKKCFYLVSIILVSNCNSKFKGSIIPTQIDRNVWTLENTPNNLDVVGAIFGIENGGSYIRIPGGKLDIKTIQSPIVLSQRKIGKNVSYGAIVNFLNLSKYLDSSVNVDFTDSAKVESVFEIKSGTLTNINDNIANAFEKQKQTIISNMNTLNLDSTKLYLVLETIHSPSVNITFDKSKAKNLAVYSKLQKLINFNSHINISNTDNNELSYELQEPLVVFYKLKRITTTISRIKGSPDKNVEISLGNDLISDELPTR